MNKIHAQNINTCDKTANKKKQSDNSKLTANHTKINNTSKRKLFHRSLEAFSDCV